MLPSKNLDDRHFEEILEQAKNVIPKLQPEWGDHRHHDPGITLLEMFAWLMEMQQYYLNRITEKNERKFLQLMGVHPQHQSYATTDVTFSMCQKKRFFRRRRDCSRGIFLSRRNIRLFWYLPAWSEFWFIQKAGRRM
ncbi:hypothetical protein [Brevibacillus sp. FIR094]|uniref:hypothetical protein n=1 Tax=Brevibacillus sp. FIR094 TaxID=3134809 RepID=UPI003D2401E9